MNVQGGSRTTVNSEESKVRRYDLSYVDKSNNINSLLGLLMRMEYY